MKVFPLPDCGSPDHLAFWSRRRLLKSSALAGLGWLTPVAQQLARGAEATGNRPKSVIVLWMEGGMSQLESFDPHPGSAIAYGGKAIATAAKGVSFGTGLPLTAELANDFSVLRSVTSKEGDHSRATYNVKTGYRPFPNLVHPSIGSIICHGLPKPEGAILDLPSHISILPGGFPARGGYLGARYDAFQTGDPVQPIPDVRPLATGDRQQKRLESLAVLEQSFAAGRLVNLESERTLHRTSVERAQRLMSSEQLAAFDVSGVPKAEREAYGDSAFGRGCLAAIRLIEAGVRCVEVTLRGWDTHLDNSKGQATQLALLDPAVSSLIRGLKERDLYEDTILLVATEFGRTVHVNGTRGTDHGTASAAMLFGGSLAKGGRINADWPGLAAGQLYESRDLKPTMRFEALVTEALSAHYGIEPERFRRTVFPDYA